MPSHGFGEQTGQSLWPGAGIPSSMRVLWGHIHLISSSPPVRPVGVPQIVEETVRGGVDDTQFLQALLDRWGNIAAVLYPVAVILTRDFLQGRLYCVQGPVYSPVADAVEAWMVFELVG